MFTRGVAAHMLLGVAITFAAPAVWTAMRQQTQILNPLRNRIAVLGARSAPERQRFEPGPGSERYRDRIAEAAKESSAMYEQWLGPLPAQSITLSRPLDLPWRSPQSFMEVESQVAYEVALQYWRSNEADETPIARSLSWYLQSRIAERLFNVRYGVLAHSTDGVRLFGGYVAWPTPSLRLSRWSAGVASNAAHRAPPTVDANTIRGALAFASLERYLGWPVLQGALRTLAATRGTAPLTVESAETIISAAAGQDLHWFFRTAFDPNVTFDYAIDALETSETSCASKPCYRTQVTAVRTGTGQFTGSAREPAGEYEAGRGVGVLVTFSDGQEASARWDGRDARRTWEFESAMPAAAARLDPEGVLLLDATSLDHVRLRSPQTNVPIAKWVARWVVWLQDAMVTGSALF